MKQVSVRSLARWVFLIIPLGAITLFSLWFIYFIISFAIYSQEAVRNNQVGKFIDDFDGLVQVGSPDANRLKVWTVDKGFPKSYQDASDLLSEFKTSWRRIDCSVPIRLEELDLQVFAQTTVVMTSVWPEVFYVISPKPIPLLDDLLSAASLSSSLEPNYGDALSSKSENAKRIPLEEFRAYEKQLRSLYPDGFSWKSEECDGFAYVEIKG